MGKTYARIDGRLRAFIEEQKIFFTATAPLSGDGRVNLSPKALDGSSALLDEHTFVYADLGGSGAETIAHLRENGRITLMWCAFTGPPSIVRVHGRGEAVLRDDPRWDALVPHFSDEVRKRTDVRAIIVVTAERISDSCGFAVPYMDFREERDLHTQRFSRETDASFNDYCAAKPHVGTSLDGLPALPLPLPPRTS
ncbi:pyridoxamine 5'-phosphate oxidase family protein [Streptomyces sp. NPDC046977]|uniref:pyridoxamine 5'-phosphate oxidase family protein n=1 Tax=Streptomyces sp. NPDC046977 TaxID=3154703 RepID=UPI0033F023F2